MARHRARPGGFGSSGGDPHAVARCNPDRAREALIDLPDTESEFSELLRNEVTPAGVTVTPAAGAPANVAPRKAGTPRAL